MPHSTPPPPSHPPAIARADTYDVIVIGAGAAGLMCAIECGKRGRRALIIDHARKPAEKIRISGGGRCNFTNLHAGPADFISQNPRFCISALRRFTQHDFIALMERHAIAYHERSWGQLFCDDSAQQIIDMLIDECDRATVKIALSTKVIEVTKDTDWRVTTHSGTLRCASLIVATGGKSIPKMGATGLGYDLARQFGLNVVAPRPALVPLTFTGDTLARMQNLAGVSVDAVVRCQKKEFSEALLFTHRGLSGPSILQISSYWSEGKEIIVNLAPNVDLFAALKTAKAERPKQALRTVIAEWLPKRLALDIIDRTGGDCRLADAPDKRLRAIGEATNHWRLAPPGSEGYRTAEVTAGGVDTKEISSKTFECTSVPGLYFVGEVLDVTGHLGGFNFQWAWSSGHAAGQFA